MASRRKLTIDRLLSEAKSFAERQSLTDEPSLFGVTDGKAVGTHVELSFRQSLLERYSFTSGNAAKGIDFPDLKVDLKVTSVKQPQSSCPFQSARQKVYGLGYHLLIFVYDKSDDLERETSRLDIRHDVFVEEHRTADFQTTTRLREIILNQGNVDDVMAFLLDRNLPLEEIGARRLADEIIKNPPEIGYLTISNALQWRLQYGRVIAESGKVGGIQKLR